MAEIRTETVAVLGGLLNVRVDVAGTGDPLVFLHSAGGLQWDPFLEGLAERYTVYAPYFPGTYPGEPNDIDHVEDLWDAVLAYDDVLSGLGIDSTLLIGHSFGGMLAAELAAHKPERISRLVLIAPIGLWHKDSPYTVADWTAKDAEGLAAVLFHNTASELVKAALTPPDDEDEAAEGLVQFLWTLGCTAKVIWPIPDKGLNKRIHRISAPALVIWGENDALIPPAYASIFGASINQAEVCMIPDCGHVPPLEQLDALNSAVNQFLD
ncbi:MAG: alpha/beta fold hydrolase [Gammaproteobacteria bacterium]|nr:alpha/beta fold hydrolase [Gammaproteobacteria bacterium]